MKAKAYSNQTGRRIGYARVSTGEQDTDAQVLALKAAGCSMIFQDIASGSNRDRPQLARLQEIVGAGDTLIVARLDRLACSLSHPLELAESLRAKVAHFCAIPL